MTDFEWTFVTLIAAAAAGHMGYAIGQAKTLKRLLPRLRQKREELAKLRRLLKLYEINP